MNPHRNYILIVFSDVNFSPQLLAILQELHNQNITFRVILIGDPSVTLARQIKAKEWNSRVIPKRGKLGSALYLFVIGIEVIRERPNVIFASGQFATVISMITGKVLNIKKRIFIRHHSNFHYRHNMRLGILMDRLANNLSTEIVAVSKVVKEILVLREAVHPEKIRIIYNGVHLEKFRNVNSKNRQETSCRHDAQNHFKIGVISRLTDLKGVEYIAQAFVKLHEEFPNSQLNIVGAFSDSYAEVSNILLPLNRGSYTIKSENNDIPQFFLDLDVFVHVPVGIQEEAFGLVYIEALASGVACIFTRSGVLNELEEPQRYVTIVAPRDSEAIYSSLRRIRLGINTSRTPIPEGWINQFSLEKTATEYGSLIAGDVKN